MVAYILLRGRCRYCGTSYHWRYVAFEVGIGLLTAGIVWLNLQHPPQAIMAPWIQSLLQADDTYVRLYMAGAVTLAIGVQLVFVYLLVVASVIDIEHLIIPDEITKGWQVVAVPLALCMAPLAAFLPVFGQPMWPVYGWFQQSEDPARAGMTGGLWVLGGILAALFILLISVPIARWIYSVRVPEEQRWDQQDHRSFRMGVWFFMGCIIAYCWVPLLSGYLADAVMQTGGAQSEHALYAGLSVHSSQAIYGMMVGWCLPYSIGLLGTCAFGRNALGYGDVKFLAPIGAFVGPVGILYVFFGAAVVGTLIGVPMRFLRQQREIPFGPSLAISAAVTLYAGPAIHAWLWG